MIAIGAAVEDKSTGQSGTVVSVWPHSLTIEWDTGETDTRRADTVDIKRADHPRDNQAH